VSNLREMMNFVVKFRNSRVDNACNWERDAKLTVARSCSAMGS